ncbi:MAG: ParB/RepB/Spo0J family partition protein [Hyphomicrobiales bacterium]|nr:ParB/RepB/Spo0J family partition protein [Hyphomicrobiales bacterium]
MADETRPRLGRGLAALIGDGTAETGAIDQSRGQKKVPIEFVRPNPKNPRKNFTDETLDELAESIRQKGIIQPIVVRTNPNLPDIYEIIAGERRWRAAQRAGLHDVPVVVADVSERESLELAIIENVQREDLNPIDEARGYEQLAADFGYSQIDLANIIGKSRSHIANTLRLLKLSSSLRKLLEEGQLTAGHGRALLASENPDSLAEQILQDGLSVREAERLAQGKPGSPAEAAPKKAKTQKDADTVALERSLADLLGMAVLIKHRGEKGELSIRYASLDQLDDLCRRLRQ